MVFLLIRSYDINTVLCQEELTNPKGFQHCLQLLLRFVLHVPIVLSAYVRHIRLFRDCHSPVDFQGTLILFIFMSILAFPNIRASSCKNIVRGQSFPSLSLAWISIHFSFSSKLSLSGKMWVA